LALLGFGVEFKFEGFIKMNFSNKLVAKIASIQSMKFVLWNDAFGCAV